MQELFSQWFLSLGSFFGLLPLVPQEDVLRFSWPIALKGSVTVVVALISSTYELRPHVYMKLNTSTKCAIAIGWMYTIGATIINLVTIARCKMGSFDNIVKKLATFERFWKNSAASEPRHRNFENKYTICFLLGLEILTGISLIKFGGFASNNEYIIATCMLLYHCIHMSMGIIQGKIVITIYQNYRRLNKIVKFCFNRDPTATSEEAWQSKVFVKDVPKVELEQIRDMHLLLCGTIDDINTFFGIQNVFYFIAISMSIVIRPYFIVGVLIKSEMEPIRKISFMCSQVAQIISSGLQLFLISYAASTTARKSKRTAYHVSRLLSRELAKDERKEVKETLLQICNSKAQIRVLNLFDVKMSLITSTVGMALGVIMLQLR